LTVPECVQYSANYRPILSSLSSYRLQPRM